MIYSWEGPNSTSESVVTYDNTLLNNSNFDLNWFLYHDEFLSLMDNTLFDFMGLYGKKSKNIVKTNYLIYNGRESQKADYTYKTDTAGNIVECNVVTDSNTKTVKLEYN